MDLTTTVPLVVRRRSTDSPKIRWSLPLEEQNNCQKSEREWEERIPKLGHYSKEIWKQTAEYSLNKLYSKIIKFTKNRAVPNTKKDDVVQLKTHTGDANYAHPSTKHK